MTRSRAKSLCPWKGLASYYTITVDGQANRNAAYVLPASQPAGPQDQELRGFWNGFRSRNQSPDPSGRPAGCCGCNQRRRSGVSTSTAQSSKRGGAVGKALAVVAAGTVLAGLAITSPELAVQGTCNCARPALTAGPR